ncbi:MAG: enoyl-CoA hydratase-related protein [Mycolicibacter sinensis]
MASTSEHVATSIHRGIGTITLRRPERLNALTWSVMDQTRAAIEGLCTRGDVRALVITGAGRGFCAGYDLVELDAGGGNLQVSVPAGIAASLNPLCEAIAHASVPVVAAVNGPCAGGGLGLALLADIAIAAESAYFVVPQVSALGVVPDAGATWALPRTLGRARALGMSITGARISADRAEQWGLIWQSVPDEELTPRAHTLAEELARRARLVVATRKLIDGAARCGLREQLAAENREQEIALRTGTAAENIRGFASKRNRESRPNASPGGG